MPSLVRDPEYRAYAVHLRDLRVRLGVSQVDLANQIGKPQSYVSKVERFERRIDPAEFQRIVIALGADPAAEFAVVVAATAGLGPREKP